MAASESLSGGHYTPSEELGVFIGWGNELTQQHPEIADAIIMSAIERTIFPPQLPIPAAILDLDPDFMPDSRQK